jgi:hypothetical protein
MGKLEKARVAVGPEQPDPDSPPPSYDALSNAPALSPEDIDQLNSGFSSLSLPSVAQDVSPDTCLAHLKLLFAFHNLQETIGYTDGLWDIHDIHENDDSVLQDIKNITDETKQILVVLREKRWAIYVARAVDRYEAWWNSFAKSPLTEADMREDSVKYGAFTSDNRADAAQPFWTGSMLPPLGKWTLFVYLNYHR